MKNTTLILGGLVPALVLSACSSSDSPVEISKEMYSILSDASDICKDIQAGKTQAADAAGDLESLSAEYVELKNKIAELDKDVDNKDEYVQDMSEFMNSDEGREMTRGIAEKLLVIGQTYASSADEKVKASLGKFIGR